MRGMPRRALVIGLLMLAFAAATFALKPTRKMSEQGTPVALEQMFPRTFGPWKVDPSIVPISVSPDVQARLDKIYNQTLARTYINTRGERIMLSIAYGGEQSDGLRAHRPEVCYANQGFQVSAVLAAVIDLAAREVPVARLVAQNGPRNEPVTYWMTVGEQVVLTGLQQKLAQIRYGLTGTIPDGLLFRVSSIGADARDAYRLQDEFTRSLLAAMSPSDRTRVIGVGPGDTRL